MVYQLILTDRELVNDNYSVDFLIRIPFRRSGRQRIQRAVLPGNVQGLCEYDCTYRIVKKEIAGNPDMSCRSPYGLLQGGIFNEYLDEIDMSKADVFLTEERDRKSAP